MGRLRVRSGRGVKAPARAVIISAVRAVIISAARAVIISAARAVIISAARAVAPEGFGRPQDTFVPLLDSAVGAGGRRVALMLAGNLRGFANFPSDEDWRTSYEHLYSVITAAGDHVVTLLCCDPDEQIVPDQAVDKLNIRVVRRKRFAQQGPRIRDCHDEVEKFERDHGAVFDVVIRARPDLVWHADAAWAALDPAKVAVRGRSLFYAHETAVSEESMAFSFRCSNSAESKSAPEYRDAMQAGGVGMCIVVDDQFAVIPREFSAQYVQSFTGCRVSDTTFDTAKQRFCDFSEMQLPTVDLPGWGAPAAVRAVCAGLEAGEFFGNGMAETELTQGLLVHAVPVEVARFPFRLSLHGADEGRRGRDRRMRQRYENGEPAKEFPC